MHTTSDGCSKRSTSSCQLSACADADDSPADGRRRCGGCSGEPRDDVDVEVDADVGGGATGGGGGDEAVVVLVVDAADAWLMVVVVVVLLPLVGMVVEVVEAGRSRGLRQPSTAGPCELSSLDG